METGSSTAGDDAGNPSSLSHRTKSSAEEAEASAFLSTPEAEASMQPVHRGGDTQVDDTLMAAADASSPEATEKLAGSTTAKGPSSTPISSDAPLRTDRATSHVQNLDQSTTSGVRQERKNTTANAVTGSSSDGPRSPSDSTAAPLRQSPGRQDAGTTATDSFEKDIFSGEAESQETSHSDNGNPLIVVDKDFVCKYPRGDCDGSPSDYWYMTSGLLSACRQVVPLGRYRWLLVLDLVCAKRMLPHLHIPPASVRRSVFQREGGDSGDEGGAEPFSLFPEADCDHKGLVDVRCAVQCGWRPPRSLQRDADEANSHAESTPEHAEADTSPPRKILRCLFQYDKEGLWGMRQEHVGSCFVIDGGCESPFEERHRIFCTGWRGQGAGFDSRDPPLPQSTDSVNLCMEDDCRDCSAFLHPETGLVTRGCPNASWQAEGGAYGPACYASVSTTSPRRAVGFRPTASEYSLHSTEDLALMNFDEHALPEAAHADSRVQRSGKPKEKEETGTEFREPQRGTEGQDSRTPAGNTQEAGRRNPEGGKSNEVAALKRGSSKREEKTEEASMEKEEGSSPSAGLRRARSLQGRGIGEAHGAMTAENRTTARDRTLHGVCFSYSNSVLPQLSIYSADEDCYGEWSDWSPCIPFHPLLQLHHRQQRSRPVSPHSPSMQSHEEPPAQRPRSNPSPHAQSVSQVASPLSTGVSVHTASSAEDGTPGGRSQVKDSDPAETRLNPEASPDRRLSQAFFLPQALFPLPFAGGLETSPAADGGERRFHSPMFPPLPGQFTASPQLGVPVPRPRDKWEVPSYDDGSPAANCYKTRVFQVYIQKHGRGRDCKEKEGSIHFATCEESEGCVDALEAAGSQFHSLLDFFLQQREAAIQEQKTLHNEEDATKRHRQATSSGTQEGNDKDEARDLVSEWGDADTHEGGLPTGADASGKTGGSANSAHAESSSQGEEEKRGERLLSPGVCPGRWSAWSDCEADCYSRRFFSLLLSSSSRECARAAAAMEMTQCREGPPFCRSASVWAGGVDGPSQRGRRDAERASPGSRDASADDGVRDEASSKVSSEADGAQKTPSDAAASPVASRQWLQIFLRPDGTMGAFDEEGNRAPLLMVSPDYKGRCGIAVGEWSLCDGLCRRFRFFSLHSLRPGDGEADRACAGRVPLMRERALCGTPSHFSPEDLLVAAAETTHPQPASGQQGRCVDPLVIVADLRVSVLLTTPSVSVAEILSGGAATGREDNEENIAGQTENFGGLNGALFNLSVIRMLAKALHLSPADLIIEQLSATEEGEEQASSAAPNVEKTVDSYPFAFAPDLMVAGSRERRKAIGVVAAEFPHAEIADSPGLRPDANASTPNASGARVSTDRLPGKSLHLSSLGDAGRMYEGLEQHSETREARGEERTAARQSVGSLRQLDAARGTTAVSSPGGVKSQAEQTASRPEERDLVFRLRILTPVFTQYMKALGLDKRGKKLKLTETSVSLSGGDGSTLQHKRETPSRDSQRRAASIMDDLEALQGTVFKLPSPLDAYVEVQRVRDRTSSAKASGREAHPAVSPSAFPAALAFLGLQGIRPRPSPPGSWGVPAGGLVVFADPLFELGPLAVYAVVFLVACGFVLAFFAICACTREHWRAKLDRAGRAATAEMQRCSLRRRQPVPQPPAFGSGGRSGGKATHSGGKRTPPPEYVWCNSVYNEQNEWEAGVREGAPEQLPVLLSGGGDSLGPTLMGKPALPTADRKADRGSAGRPAVSVPNAGPMPSPPQGERHPGLLFPSGSQEAATTRGGWSLVHTGRETERPGTLDPEARQSTCLRSQGRSQPLSAFFSRLRNFQADSTREAAYERHSDVGGQGAGDSRLPEET
ncbi:hypothetical protein BESB_031290 [Besnoitia besnoiti]|uniref:Transmembrane protein n=1 Tax=Besnoitia besnoiti TaxID=94643 RepID=A0A2A9LZT7_BESBE|nr:hypothetical protein BESB_031290 [Besnoitia besnoiti]PFH31255.1 hypothetical protein BESB_031290 [Besnoitia besnoiti]